MRPDLNLAHKASMVTHQRLVKDNLQRSIVQPSLSKKLDPYYRSRASPLRSVGSMCLTAYITGI
jgi:hypothetical protein